MSSGSDISGATWAARLERAFVPLIAVVGILGLVSPGPLRAAVDRNAINVVLAFLVLTSGASVPTGTVQHDGRGFVYAILQLAHTLHLETIAEGVEHAEQHDDLRGLGCTRVQGYFFARPMPAEQAYDYLAAMSPARTGH